MKNEVILKRLEKALEELKRQQLAHLKYRLEYAQEMVDLVKMQAINVGPMGKSMAAAAEKPVQPVGKKRKKSK